MSPILLGHHLAMGNHQAMGHTLEPCWIGDFVAFIDGDLHHRLTAIGPGLLGERKETYLRMVCAIENLRYAQRLAEPTSHA
jgi:hypothetical protein